MSLDSAYWSLLSSQATRLGLILILPEYAETFRPTGSQIFPTILYPRVETTFLIKQD